jgi:adenylosuccinate lyase
MKQGLPCDLPERLLAEKAFGLMKEDLDRLLDPSLYTGRCAEQVELFLDRVRPLLEGLEEEKAEISV